MDWQQVSALAIVTATAGIFAWSRLRRRRFDFHRDTHCGCSGTNRHAQNNANTIIFHARKGARPEVIVKMK